MTHQFSRRLFLASPTLLAVPALPEAAAPIPNMLEVVFRVNAAISLDYATMIAAVSGIPLHVVLQQPKHAIETAEQYRERMLDMLVEHFKAAFRKALAQ